LGELPSCISIFQGVLDRCEEKNVLGEATLDELRGHLQRLRNFVKEDLETAREGFESLRGQLLARSLDDEAAQARDAIRNLRRMQETERVDPEELPALDDLYSTLLGPLAFDR
jgi:hypothetical protein